MRNYVFNFSDNDNEYGNFEMEKEKAVEDNRKHSTAALSFWLIVLIIFFVINFKGLDSWISNCNSYSHNFLVNDFDNEIEEFFYLLFFPITLMKIICEFVLPYGFGVITCIIGAVCYKSALKKETQAFNESDKKRLSAYKSLFLISVLANSLICFLELLVSLILL